MKKYELLAPAGTPEALSAAMSEGADAAYLGLKTFNARLRSGNFAFSQFEGALRAAHRLGRKIYLTLNTVWTEREADRMYQLLKYVAMTGCDGVIVQDLGTLNLIRSFFPKLAVHASTQMNIASSLACNFLSKQQVSRVVLARELNLEQIKTIRAQTNIELEVFVHGALCVSVSGLCLFSSYLGGKSANRGMCTQACRRLYTAGDEDKYYFSPLDLQLIEKVPALCYAGVDSFKIEGRMKSAEYAGIVTAAYRAVLDAVEEAGTEAAYAPLENTILQKAAARAKAILRNDFAREKTFFHFEEDESGAGGIHTENGNPARYLKPENDGGAGIRLGVISAVRGGMDEQSALIENAALVPNEGDSIRLHRADDSMRLPHKIKRLEKSEENHFWTDIPGGFGIGDIVYLIQTKAASKRYANLLAKDLSLFTKKPGHDKAPEIRLEFAHTAMPPGLYIAVQRPEDLYIAQSIRTERVILHTSIEDTARLLKREKPLPYKPREIILSLDPFFAETSNGEGKTPRHRAAALIEAGYKQFIVNNLGHIPLFKGTKDVTLIAGPYLYAFNRAAADFISRWTAAIVLPLENSRQNAERVFDRNTRARVFVTVFAYPALFRIQSELRGMYNFKTFSDRLGGEYILSGGKGSSLVTSVQPFSITDKIPFLQTSGFRRFILDFSPQPLQKVFYKEVVRAAQDARPLPGSTRFNWKNGFYEIETKKNNIQIERTQTEAVSKRQF